jgi:hypothetical protein
MFEGVISSVFAYKFGFLVFFFNLIFIFILILYFILTSFPVKYFRSVI